MKIENFGLSVLVWREDEKVIAAQCLQTGSVVTANDVPTAQSMMVELLRDEVSYNLQHKNMHNLFGTPAPFEIWEGYHSPGGKLATADFILFKIIA